MGYYVGDFYAGARGDPGIGSFFGGLIKRAVGFIPGVGPIASAAVGAIMPGGARAATSGIMTKATGIIMKHPVVSGAAAAGIGGGAIGAGVGRKMLTAGHMGGMQKGYHTSKKTGKVVRNRHMNACNPRALRRAIRRAHSFAKLAMHTIHLVHPKKKGRFGGFKSRRKKK
jgi:hypothetical protein